MSSRRWSNDSLLLSDLVIQTLVLFKIVWPKRLKEDQVWMTGKMNSEAPVMQVLIKTGENKQEKRQEQLKPRDFNPLHHHFPTGSVQFLHHSIIVADRSILMVWRMTVAIGLATVHHHYLEYRKRKW